MGTMGDFEGGVVHRGFSLRRIAAIAENTLLELVRMKVFYFLLLFALLVIGGSFFAVDFTFQEQFQVLKDISLGAISIFSWLLGLLCAAGLLPKDREDRTLYTILAKPVSRMEYVFGKLFGVYGLIAISVVGMSLLFFAVLALREHQVLLETASKVRSDELEKALAEVRASAFQWNLVPGIALIYVKAVLCATLTLLFSTFASSSIFTVLVSVVVYFIGHAQGVAREYWLRGGEVSWVTKGGVALVALVFPDLQLFNVVDEIAVGTVVPWGMFLEIVGLGGLYTAVYLLLAQLIFANKEL